MTTKNIEDIIGLTPLQEGMLFHYLVDKESNLYYELVSLNISGRFEKEIFIKAWQQVVEDNEMLRASFRWEDIKAPVQVIYATVSPDLHFYDFSEEGDPAAALADLLEQMKQRRFDLQEETPLVISLCKLAELKYELTILSHHILFDGWSTGILLKHFFQFYTSLEAGKETELSPKNKFREYVRFLKGRPADSIFWKDYLKELQIAPLRRVRMPSLQEKNIANCLRFILEPALVKDLQHLLNQQHLTLAACLYGCWALALGAYSGNTDVIIGTTVSGRNAPVKGIGDIVGLFINTVPLRVQVKGEISGLEFLKEVAASLLEREAHEHTSLALIKQLSGIEQGASLFESLVVIENYPLDFKENNIAGGFTLHNFNYHQQTNYPLTLTVYPSRDGVSVTLSYNQNLYEPQLAAGLMGAFERIIRHIVDVPGSLVKDLPMLSAADMDEMLSAPTSQEMYVNGESISAIVDGNCSTYPDKVAIVFNRENLTYGHLYERVTFLARILAAGGVSKGIAVGIYLERSPEIIISMLAILKSGGVYLPIDPSLPAERVKYMLEDAGVKCVLVSALTANEIDNSYKKINVTGITDNGLQADVLPNVLPTDPAYIIYTSGSTGKPKGVVIRHSGVVNFVRGMVNIIPFAEGPRFLSLTTLSFDIFVLETLLPLMHGYTICLGNASEQKDPVLAGGMLLENKVTLAQFTPSQLSAFLEEQKFREGLQQAEFLLLGGEPLTGDLLGRIKSVYQGKIYNVYGPTETTVWTSVSDLTQQDSIDIGKPVMNTSMLILDEHLRVVPFGVQGTLYIGGAGLAAGYLNCPELTAQKFIPHPYFPGERLYNTGDLAVRNINGQFEFIGRRDTQVKIRGYRIELGEIEFHLQQHPLLSAAAVLSRERDGVGYLYAFYVAIGHLPVNELKTYLSQFLPEYMVPSFFIQLEAMPLTANGKTDRKALITYEGGITENTNTAPYTVLESELTAIWKDVLKINDIGVTDSFFDAGGTSLLSIRLVSQLNRKFQSDLTVVDVFEHATIRKLANRILKTTDKPTADLPVDERETDYADSIAVIGMAGRFPGSQDISAFWNSLKEGRECISFLEGDNQAQSGSMDAGYVKAKGRLEAAEYFDASFFGYTPFEAAHMDPQMRIFHEMTWEALEHAGYDPFSYKGAIGLYAGATPNSRFESEIILNEQTTFSEKWNAMQYADKDFLSTRISYKLNLRGPSFTIHSACSTSLVAIDLACSELKNGKCDIALAGGISVTFYDEEGYQYTEGMIFSPDGHCRAFDKESKGTVSGNGGGVVVLKPLKQALRDGDHIMAVILGTAVNNDGSDKAGYTAPGVTGQEKVIRAALRNARIDPATVSYIETHGTGTPIGDVIEIEALKRGYGTGETKSCAIGSVKTNIGHLDVAAGVAGFIKTVLALQYQELPPSLHFTTPNPALSLSASRFYVNDSAKQWERRNTPLRAAVTSLGLGGTNVHMILEEAIAKKEDEYLSNPAETLLLSANSPEALNSITTKLINFLQHNPGINFSDVAYTLQTGRKHFRYRRSVPCTDIRDAVTSLLREQYTSTVSPKEGSAVIFMFSGQGAQYIDMGLELYEYLPAFRRIIDGLFERLKALSTDNFLEVLYPGLFQQALSEDKEHDTYYLQPVIFIFQYGLATLLRGWGVEPVAMIGHSMGEYTAACLAGVFSADDALKLLLKRGELMKKTCEGRMMSVNIAEAELRQWLQPGVDLAAVNAPGLCVVSGEAKAVETLATSLSEAGIEMLNLKVRLGGHSLLMDPILEEFLETAKTVVYHDPVIPFISGMSGTWITGAEATSPQYWADHIRKPTRFYEGMNKLIAAYDNGIFLQVGAGKELCLFLERNDNRKPGHVANNLIKRKQDPVSDLYYLNKQLGEIWSNGGVIDWNAFHGHLPRRKVPLPTYAFERQLFAVTKGMQPIPRGIPKVAGVVNAADSIYIPSWKNTINGSRKIIQHYTNVLIFTDDPEAGSALSGRLSGSIGQVVFVASGNDFKKIAANSYEVIPAEPSHYALLLEELLKDGLLPDLVIHLWNVTGREERADQLRVQQNLDTGYYSVCALGVALENIISIDKKTTLLVITDHMQYVVGDQVVHPGKAPVMAAVDGLNIECSKISCKSIDVSLDVNRGAAIAEIVAEELSIVAADPFVVYRGKDRMVKYYELTAVDGENNEIFRPSGTVLLTGGLSGVGFEVAKHLAGGNLTLVILGRRDIEQNSLQEKRLEELKSAHQHVYYFRCDVSDASATATMIDTVQATHGKISGVLHGAGVPGGKVLQLLDTAASAQVLAPKVNGVLNLYHCLKDRELDFFMLFSSIGNITPYFGQTDYCAANHFLDAFAAYARLNSGPQLLSVNWDRWKNTGMAVNAEQQHYTLSGQQLEGGIDVRDGIIIFEKILPARYYQLVVSSLPLMERIRDNREQISKKDSLLSKVAVNATAQLNRSGMSSVYAAGTIDYEHTLLALWEEILGYKNIGVDDDFFELGGDSLRATILLAKIFKTFQVKISLIDFLQQSTIAQTAAKIHRSSKMAFYDISPQGKADSYPLSPSQRRLYLMQQWDPAMVAYNETDVFQLKGPVDEARVKAALQELINRHESLRTTFHLLDGMECQVVEEDVIIELEIKEAAGNEEAFIRSFVRPFDLAKEIPFRAALVKRTAEDYLLLIDIHHIATDGFSKNLLLKDFMRLYQGENLPAVAIHPKDYAIWCLGKQHSAEIERQAAFWKNQFKDEWAPLQLPNDYSRSAIPAYEGDTVLFEISPGLRESLSAIAKQNNTNEYMVLLSVYFIFLSRLYNQQEVIIGTPVSGRNHERLTHSIGMFVNTLPLRCQVIDGMSFTAFVNQVKRCTLTAIENQDYQFENIIMDLDIPLYNGANPLFDTVFVYNDESFSSVIMENIQISSYPQKRKVSKFDLSLYVHCDDIGKCSFEFYYKTSLFKRTTILQFAACFTQLLESLSVQPDILVSELSMLSEDARTQIMTVFNPAVSNVSCNKTVHAAFDEQVSLHPNHLAIVSGTDALTYTALKEQSDRLCSYLQHKGVTAGSIVALLTERSAEMIIFKLAVLKAGAVYLPISLKYPRSRVDYLLDDSRAAVILSSAESAEQVADMCIPVLTLQDALEKVYPLLPVDITAGHPAYIIYTSGSTGQPKGVIVEHQAIHAMLRLKEMLNIPEEVNFLQTGAVVFDAAVFEIWYTLLNGGTLFLIDEEHLFRADKLSSFIQAHQITYTFFTPALFNQLVDQDPAVFTGMQGILLGGDVVSPRHLRLVGEHSPGVRIFNGYGPTENTVFTTFYEIKDLPADDPVPIGRTFNSQVYILNQHKQLFPVGISGELYIGGDQLGRGYLNNPELTSARFIDNPFGAGRLYRTGDIAKWLPDGNIAFIGRRDTQVKIRGFRVETTEIEICIAAFPGIAAVVVDILTDQDGQHYLAAWFTAGAQVPLSLIRQHVEQRLPYYMIPRHFMQLEILPVTVNGKINRKALPLPVVRINKTEEELFTPLQRCMADIWSAVLQLPAVGLHDDFFELGGDSIKSIQISIRLRSLGYSIDIRDLFLYPTVALISSQVKLLGKAIPGPEAMTGGLELSPAQRWFFHHQAAYHDHFNQHVVLFRQAGFEEALIREAVKTVLQHHDIIRSAFAVDEKDEISAVIREHNNDAVTFSSYNLTSVADVAEHIEILAAGIQSALNIKTGPLAASALFKTNTGDHLLIVIHHLVVDAVSWRILLEQLHTVYDQLLQRKQVVMPVKDNAYATWTERLKRYATDLLDANRDQTELAYWEELDIQGAAVLDKATQLQERLEADTLIVTAVLDAPRTGDLLKNCHRAYNTRVQDLLLAALGAALKAWTGNDKFIINQEGHGREPLFPDIDITATIGWFTCMYPVVLDVSRADDPAFYIKSIKEYLRKIPHNGVGYNLIRYMSASKPAHAVWNITPEISFNYLGQLDNLALTHFTRSSLQGGKAFGDRLKSLFPLNLNCLIEDGQLKVYIGYNEMEFTTAEIESFARKFISALEETIAHCVAITTPELTPSDCDAMLSIAEFDALQEIIREAAGQGTAIQSVSALSPMQEGILFYHLHGPSTTAYFVQLVFDIEEALDAAVFLESVKQLSGRHEILRTRIVADGFSRPLQVVLSGNITGGSYLDLSEMEETSRTVVIAEKKQEDLAKGFDLLNNDLLRVMLIRTAADRYSVIWSFHHIIMDGWCLGILLEELLAIYHGLLHQRPIVLKKAGQYSTYLKWLSARDKKSESAFWSGYLSGISEVTVLPGGHNEVREYKNAAQTILLDSDTFVALQELARQTGVTMSTVVQTAWGVLLSKLTSSDDITFGTVVSGRSDEVDGIDTMIGLFINTVPVRIKIATEETVIGLLKRVMENHLACVPHQYCALADILETSPFKSRLVNHLLIFENYPEIEGQRTADGTSFKISGSGTYEETNYNFNLVIHPRRDSMKVSVYYNELVFDSLQVERTIGQFLRILKAIANQSSQRVSEIAIISPAERREILEVFNKTKVMPSPADNISSLLEQQAMINGSGIALSYLDQQINYASLSIAARKLGNFLCQKGIGPGSKIAVKMNRSIEMMIAIYGILNTGAAYVPIGMDFPAERIQYMLADSNVTILLCDDASDQYDGTESLCMRDGFYETASTQALSAVSPDALAYIMYTSGSTGKPKGVMVTHASILNTLTCLSSRYPMLPGDSYLFKTPLVFDVCIQELFESLYSGNRLVILQQGLERDPYSILSEVHRSGITHLCLVPSLFNALADILDYELAQQMVSVKHLFVAGEAMDGAAVRKFRQFNKQTQLINAYGPTEASIYASLFDLDEWDGVSPIPIGRPVDNMKLLVLDPGMQLQPIGVEGEIFISGPGVAAGYLNNKALTEMAFLDDPYYETGRLYKTGDRGKWLPSGIVAYTGRKDEQVKLRGLRIELGEIEAVLNSFPGIQASVVLIAGSDNPHICAWYTASDALVAGELADYLLKQLPRYMVPSRFMHVAAIPLTPSGKVNKPELLKFLETMSQVPVHNMTVDGDVANSIERRLIKIWGHILKIDPEHIRLTDHFFEKGGHSIKAVYLLAAIRKEFNHLFSLEDLYRYPVIKELARHIGVSRQQNGAAIKRAEKKEYYPLSPSQRRIYYFQALNPGSIAYNMPQVIDIDMEVTPDRLEKVFQYIIRAHDSFRLSFSMIDNIPVQKLQEEVVLATDYYTAGDESDLSVIRKQFVRPFDLEVAPLIRACIVEMGDRRKLLVDVHHIIYDGTSQHLVGQEFLQLLQDGLAPAKSSLAYIDYVAWMKSSGYQARIASQERFWKNVFSRTPLLLNLPADQPLSSGVGYTGAIVRFHADEQTVRKIFRFAETRRVSLFTFIFSVFNVFIAKLARQEDIVIGVPVAGRPEADFEGIVGMFVNYLAIRSEVNMDTTFAAFLTDTKANILQCFDNQDYQYDSLLDMLQLRTVKGRNPLFDVVCNYIDTENETDHFNIAENWDKPGREAATAKNNLILRIVKVGDNLLFEFEYAVPMFREQTIRNFVDYFLTLIKGVMQYPDNRIGTFKMTGNDKHNQADLLRAGLK
ncbi:non-ribosomal peptide synthetase/type I polyketide synthase [Chitinophaga sp. Ak27]|uniref:non-ribosomal peptide synthetase/type I polyketide synthase n=1 Tax=Chitinophaga sp. Ak27 TaxID=2726116 RepID=UPI00145F1447|nr:non-ribosomal peptide synthetase/type I polyketide synthase [Chitinophaga sp. Ak27]NLU93263.1 amino acid adenylation domain-containing protein [Chitinophaga sp. Ak27]